MQRNNGRKIVFVSDNGVAKEVDVRTGIGYDGFTEILNAPALEGKQVVVVGQTFINNGDRLSLIDIKE